MLCMHKLRPPKPARAVSSVPVVLAHVFVAQLGMLRDFYPSRNLHLLHLQMEGLLGLRAADTCARVLHLNPVLLIRSVKLLQTLAQLGVCMHEPGENQNGFTVRRSWLLLPVAGCTPVHEHEL